VEPGWQAGGLGAQAVLLITPRALCGSGEALPS
jgi:hypothetical protein